MSAITTHVLDTAKGRPARGVTACLELKVGGQWKELARGATNSDGRIADLLPKDQPLETGIYRLTFETGDYFKANGGDGFYPSVPILFEIKAPTEHYHVPLLLSPFGYSTYRGS